MEGAQLENSAEAAAALRAICRCLRRVHPLPGVAAAVVLRLDEACGLPAGVRWAGAGSLAASGGPALDHVLWMMRLAAEAVMRAWPPPGLADFARMPLPSRLPVGPVIDAARRRVIAGLTADALAVIRDDAAFPIGGPMLTPPAVVQVVRREVAADLARDVTALRPDTRPADARPPDTRPAVPLPADARPPVARRLF